MRLERMKKEAVHKGLDYMERLLHENVALSEMGEQAIGMFYDLARGCSDSEIATKAATICRDLLKRMNLILTLTLSPYLLKKMTLTLMLILTLTPMLILTLTLS